jgi:ubiquinone/menaquinone biosynthesis C-methylase UbiE
MPRAETGGGRCPPPHAGVVAGDFQGDVATFYARHRRGYPAAFTSLLASALRLGADALVADVGCGTGQLTVPLAALARAVAGVDPEPDMLALAARAAAGQGVTNVTWVLGSDEALPALGALAGQALDAVTVANAIHLMPERRLFAAAMAVLRPGGGIAVIANGTPLWQQPSDWSRALRQALEQWLGTRLESCCGTDPRSRQRYRDAMLVAGLTEIREESVDYTGHLDLDEVVGGVYSAMPARLLPPPAERPAFAAHLRRAVGPAARFTEQVRVAALLGYRP